MSKKPKILRPHEFTEQDKKYLLHLKNSINQLTSFSNLIMGIKDIDSIHLHSSPEYARIVGLSNSNDIIGRSDFDMPCDGTAQFAQQYLIEDRSIIESANISTSLTTLNIHNYADGLKTRVFEKKAIYNPESNAILGIFYSGNSVEVSEFLNIIPNYHLKFGEIDSLTITSKNKLPLNSYEEEICYLLIMNWELKQIAQFMNTYRPTKIVRTSDTIRKKKDYICNKLDVVPNSIPNLVEFLIGIGFHKTIPESFFARIIGSKIIRQR